MSAVADIRREFLNPARKLVDEVADWLCGTGAYTGGGRVRRSPEGAATLDHIMVVVPTAQSGRNLRFALADRFRDRGLLPPHIVLPMQLVRPADVALREATPVEAAAAFQQYVKVARTRILALDCLVRSEEFDDLTARFALFDQLQDIWRTLAGRGLLMADVPIRGKRRLETDWGDEKRRWEQLAELERGYFEFLHGLGLSYPTELVCAARTHAAPPDPAVGEIVLPALADPVRVLGDVLEQHLNAGLRLSVLVHAAPSASDRFDRWGWPRAECWTGAARPVLERLRNEDIVCTPDVSALARVVAADFPAAESGSAVPSLALCDDGLFQGVASALLNRGYLLHNPERHLLAQSSLGRLARDLLSLYPPDELPWQAFVGVLRSDDVMRALGLSGSTRASVLEGLDITQNAFLPNVIPAGFAFPDDNDMRSWQVAAYDAFRTAGRAVEARLNESRRDASLSVFLRRMLKWIFDGHMLAGGASEKEFMAAAGAMRAFLDGLEGDVVSSLSLSDAEFDALARRELSAVAYSLEPDAPDALKTEGWLELAWSASDRLSLVGLHEGKVPDSVLGHPFLPDALRMELGLVTNEDRLARDTWILSEVLDSHAEHGVRAYVARADGAGDLCRPSRLLYLCTDAALPARIKGLFGELPLERSDKVRRIEWPLALPDRITPPDHFSPSALDTYVKCPFTYLLKYGLGMNAFREKRELEAGDFGAFVHDVLEAYAIRQIARGDDQLTDACAIRRLLLEELVPVQRARYGKTTLNLDLQLAAAEGRLALFAEAQAAWAAQGWRIRMAEHRVNAFVPEIGTRISGYVDRLDENLLVDTSKRWCLVDYKTWDEKNLSGRIFTSERSSDKQMRQLALARALGFPLVLNKRGEPSQGMLSVQLPVYGKCLSAAHAEVSFSDMQFRYLILGSNVGQTGFCPPLTDSQVAASVGTARRAVELIGKGVFWPPGPSDTWRWDFAGLFVTDPATDLEGTEWALRQRARLEAAHV